MTEHDSPPPRRAPYDDLASAATGVGTRSSPSPAPTLDELITAWGLMSEATVVVANRLAQGLGDGGPFSLPEFDVLVRLFREPSGRLPMVRIATEVGLTSGGLTKLVDRLEQRGLVTRQRSVTDRRVVYAVLRAAGREAVSASLTGHAADLRRHLLAPLGADGVRELAALCRVLRDRNR